MLVTGRTFISISVWPLQGAAADRFRLAQLDLPELGWGTKRQQSAARRQANEPVSWILSVPSI